jgi:hypothetical protein
VGLSRCDRERNISASVGNRIAVKRIMNAIKNVGIMDLLNRRYYV